MKKICILVVFCLLLPLTVFAAEEKTPVPTIPAQRQLPLLVDEASLLSASEEKVLLEKLENISQKRKCDVAVVTVESLGNKSATAYADDFYDYNGYGYGVNDDGILLLISMEKRDWAITTYGFAKTAFTKSGQEYMVEQFRPYLSDGDYSKAFLCFADLCDDFLEKAAAGNRYDTGNLPRTAFKPIWVLMALGIGFLIAIIAVSMMKSKLKSVRRQPAASSYIRPDSFQVTQSQDIFLYRNVTRTARPKDTGSSSGGGHISSSGRSHGGSSGKF